jgi:peptide/nickel transport system permease protein
MMMKTKSKLDEMSALNELIRSRSGFVGISILAVVLAIAIAAVLIYPYSYIISVWGDIEPWKENPSLARPTWYNVISSANLPPNNVFDTREANPQTSKSHATFGNITIYQITFRFSYDYDDFPSDINAFFYSNFTKPPLIEINFVRPDGREIKYWSGTLDKNISFVTLANSPVAKRNIEEYYYNSFGSTVFNPPTQVVVFAVHEPNMTKPSEARVLKSDGKNYVIKIRATFYEARTDFDVRLIIYGKVWGLLGTDNRGRDLLIPFLWGAPIALSFGMSLSVLLTILQLIIGTSSAWFGGKVDFIIQKLVEFNMAVPFLSILILVATFFRISLWVMILAIIVLSLFGGGIKNTRALALQLKQQPYVEAAIAYGVSNFGIITKYIIYPMIPLLIPGIIGSIPGFVFLEASLAFLGLGDPVLPTWGNTINEAYSSGAVYHWYWWWILPPIVALILIAVSFSFIGYALDKIVNPRLREL